MTPTALSATLSRLALSRREAAALLGVSKRTVDGWCAGRFAVPGPVQVLLRLMEHSEFPWAIARREAEMP